MIPLMLKNPGGVHRRVIRDAHGKEEGVYEFSHGVVTEVEEAHLPQVKRSLGHLVIATVEHNGKGDKAVRRIRADHDATAQLIADLHKGKTPEKAAKKATAKAEKKSAKKAKPKK